MKIIMDDVDKRAFSWLERGNFGMIKAGRNDACNILPALTKTDRRTINHG